MVFLLTDSPQKLKFEKVLFTLIILFHVSLSYPSLQSRFIENAKILCKSSTTQENITITRQNLLFLLKTQKSNHSSAGDWWKNTKSSFNASEKIIKKRKLQTRN